uniref:Uncharacterized protein n=1 Tax=Globisporangium ultimum (strain ATCC 200006 / CBS 805.95 / DAOM BR144) TaxID=431595 RepID=K3X6Q8_GLOUD
MLLLFVRDTGIGKDSTVLYNCLVESNPDMLIAHVQANLMPESAQFSEFFKSIYNCEFSALCALECERVVLIDEAHMTYDDELLWLGYIKDVLEEQIPSLRIALFVSHGSFDVYRKLNYHGPGLRLARAELGEMVCGTVGDLCSGHIGIAGAILDFCTSGLAQSVQDPLMSAISRRNSGRSGCFNSLAAAVAAFPSAIQNHGLSDESRVKMKEVMDDVALGKVVRSTELLRAVLLSSS